MAYPNYRTVSWKRKDGALLVKITRVGNSGTYFAGFVVIFAVFISGLCLFAPLLLTVTGLSEALLCLLPIAFVLVWFMVCVRVCSSHCAPSSFL